jgi:uncharacterized protein YllA (UPF0747 family)
MNIDDKLSQVFDVAPIEKQEVLPAVQATPINKDLESDFETTRSNLHSILQQGQEALFHALSVAKQSEHPRAFEVVGGLVKHLSDVNTQLLDLHKRKQSIEAPTKKEAAVTNNNAIFVGSTSDLSKMLNDLRKGK